MVDSIVIESFTKDDSEKLFKAYLKIKFQVFVVELGWHTLADVTGKQTSQEDPFDSQAQFFMAISEKGFPIAVVRGISLKKGFPHRNLFEHHCHNAVFSEMVSNLCTFNSLAVMPYYRKKKYQVAGRSWKESVGKIIMLAFINAFELEDHDGAVATAGGSAAARFFTRIGFGVIDRPTITPLHPEPFTNIGLVFGSPAHKKFQETCNMKTRQILNMPEDRVQLARYFEERAHQAMVSNALDER